MSEMLSELLKDHYKVIFFNCGDADAALIEYNSVFAYSKSSFLIDAGNRTDGELIADYLICNCGGVIDWAFLSHPHEDHIGGFFTLLDNPRIAVKNFVFLDPDVLLDSIRNAQRGDFQATLEFDNLLRLLGSRKGHQYDGMELLDELLKKLNKLTPSLDFSTRLFCYTAGSGSGCAELPPCIKILGPNPLKFEELYNADLAKRMATSFVLAATGKRSIDKTEDDKLRTNIASLVLGFVPTGGDTFLFSGDAPASILEGVAYRSALGGTPLIGCVFKVPHHGSKHNASSNLYSLLKPSCAVISAKGPIDEHPARGVVSALRMEKSRIYATYKVPDHEPGIVFTHSRLGRPTNETSSL